MKKMFRKMFKKKQKKLSKEDLFNLIKPDQNKAWQIIGTEYGGFYIPQNTLSRDSICYCLGAGEDVSFDLGLINRFNCEVITIDPTPRAIKHYETIIENTKNNESTEIISGEVSEVYYKINPQIPEKWKYLPYGVWVEDTTMKFYAPENPEHVSHSIVNLQETQSYFEAECKTLKSLMEMMNHKKIDLVKMNIEGIEHDIIRYILENNINPEILLVTFDQPCPAEKIKESAEYIISRGYDLCKIKNWNFHFLRAS